jgi:hypothetical protein
VSPRGCFATSWRFNSFIKTKTPLLRLLQISNSLLAIYLRQIDLGFEFQHYQFSPIEILYVGDLTGILSPCLSRFRNLMALEFHGPPATLPQEHRRVYINTTVAALRYVPFLRLTEFDITLPITRNFAQFFPDRTTVLQIPIEDVLDRLHHLGLYVCAQTTIMDTDLKGLEYVAHPNSPTSFHLHRMIALSINLKSLAISGEDHICFEYFGIYFPTSLQALHVKGTTMTSDTIIALIRRSHKCLKYIEFLNIKLSSGT